MSRRLEASSGSSGDRPSILKLTRVLHPVKRTLRARLDGEDGVVKISTNSLLTPSSRVGTVVRC